MNKQRCFFLFASLAFLLFAAGHLHAQGEDPFGGPVADPFGSAPKGQDPFGSGNSGSTGAMDAFGAFGGNNNAVAPAADAGTDLNEERDPVVQLLRSDPPKNPKDMAKGLVWMIRIKRWDEVGRLLDSVAGFNWNDAQKVSLSRGVGSANWIRLKSEDVTLSDPQSVLASELMVLPSQIAKNPRWIEGLISQLASPSVNVRRMATLRLYDSGSLGIQSLVNHLLAGDTPVKPAVLCSTALSFGSEGVEALSAACGAMDPAKSSRVVMAVATTAEREFALEIAAGLINTKTSVADKEALVKQVASFSSIPKPDAINTQLAAVFASRLEAYQRARVTPNLGSRRVWRLDASRNAVMFVDAAEENGALTRLAEVAVMQLRAGGTNESTTVNALIALLQSEYQWNPTVHPASFNPQQSLPEVDPSLLTLERLKTAFERASELQMHGSAILAMQLLPKQLDAPTLGFLSDALADSRPIIRYMALESLQKLDPKQDFRGSSQAVRTAIEMSKLASGPHTLVIGLQADLRQTAAEQIQMITTAEVTVVKSAKAALLALEGDRPVELIVICDRVRDQTLFEFLQRVRNSAKGEALPIAILIEQLKPYEERLIGSLGGVVRSLLTTDPAQMRRVVSQLLGELDSEPLSEIDRSEFAAAAMRFLSQITSDRETYSFYSVSGVRAALAQTVKSLVGPQRASILSGMGTSDSQLELVELAAAGDEAERLLAAKAFAVSVKRFGNQLGKAGVKQSYELYNDLGPKDPSNMRILGFVLDVIEAQAGERDWPAL